MRKAISGTAEWGSYVSGKKIIDEPSKVAMRNVLEDIRNGTFAECWISEFESGNKNLLDSRTAENGEPLEIVGAALRKRMPFLKP